MIVRLFFKSLLLALVLTLSACGVNKQEPIKLVANSWIGYSPLFYAKEKGWLDELNIELATVVSLGESLMTYQTGHFVGLTGTQYELKQLNKQQADLIPVIMLDRSNGGDMVMSNRPLAELKNSEQEIDVYMEVESINSVVFKDFTKAHQLDNKSFNYINKDQLKIVTQIKNTTDLKPSIIITYIPYNFELEDHGFNTVASTKDIDDIIVLDALYIDRQTLIKNRETFEQLKNKINHALADLKADPKAYYDLVKPYIENPSFEEFKASLNDIEWLNDKLSDEMINKMNQINFPSRDLI